MSALTNLGFVPTIEEGDDVPEENESSDSEDEVTRRFLLSENHIGLLRFV